MNGQLSEHPLAELIREISAKKLSGRLRVQQNRIAVVAYFKEGAFLYAAANIRTLRLREYLTKLNLVSEQQLAGLGEHKSDLELAAALVAGNTVQAKTIRDVQLKQVADVLRLALLWVEGTWDFDHRSHLNEPVNFRLNPTPLFLEAARRLPLNFASSRLRNGKEILSLNQSTPGTNQLEPREGFILSRLDRPTALNELIAVSGLRDADAYRVVYGLAISDYIVRERWKSAFRDVAPEAVAHTKAEERAPTAQGEQPTQPSAQSDLTTYLERVESASTHYEILSISNDVSPADLKSAYYDFARRYHPDRFRTKEDEPLHGRIEAAFARITQAYETLGDPGSRATYDLKLAARARARSAVPTSQPTAPTTTTAAPEQPSATATFETAEEQFREGLVALKSGQTRTAISNFALAAKAFPNEARYRAFYGHALSAQETSRRLAEVELQAALKIEPENADYRTMLAQLYKALGFSKRARAEAERALTTAPNHEAARALLRELLVS
jgi:curved DNA-binding protein CbpA